LTEPFMTSLACRTSASRFFKFQTCGRHVPMNYNDTQCFSAISMMLWVRPFTFRQRQICRWAVQTLFTIPVLAIFLLLLLFSTFSEREITEDVQSRMQLPSSGCLLLFHLGSI
jgi:hypothetical protein